MVIIGKQQKEMTASQMNVKTANSNRKKALIADGDLEEKRLYPYKLENGVTLELSFEAREKLIGMEAAMHNLEVTGQQTEAMKEEIDDFGKIMTIFRRIANGDIVPGQDEKKLMEYSMEMYQMAKAAAALAENKDPEEYDSVDKEKQEKGVPKSAAKMGSPAVSVTLPASGTAEEAASTENEVNEV